VFTNYSSSRTHNVETVFNFWEPLHYLDRGYGFQTWETSPLYAIRSYAYVLLHWLPVRIARVIVLEKVSWPVLAPDLVMLILPSASSLFRRANPTGPDVHPHRSPILSGRS
jgi:hypothetical protein